MAYNWNGQNVNLPISNQGEVLPQELSNDYFANLDQAMARSEGRQMERVLGDLGDRGFLRSGDTFTQVADQVLGPAQDRRNQLLLGQAQTAAGQGRDERLQTTAYNRSLDFADKQHQYQLEEIQARADVQKMLMELETSLQNQGGFDWGQVAGQAAGSLGGAVFGQIGAGAGVSVRNKLFGPSGQQMSH